MPEVIEPNKAFHDLKRAVQSDPQCALNWHGTIAQAALQEGVNRDCANRMARRLVKHWFDVNTGDQ